jgi:SspJ family small acid-soluble spore protein
MRAERERIGRFTGKIKSVADFLSDATKAFKDQPLVEAVTKVAPCPART